MNTLSFPGLGIGEFSINSVAFTIFGKDVAWYGILITLGFVLAFFYVLYRAKFEKVKSDDILDLAIFVIIFGMIGTRLYYVIMKWDNYVVTGGYFWENVKDTFINIISVWNGGLAIYGGLIAGTLTAVIFAKIKKIKFTKILDMLAPAAMIGQIIGRWGNFFNVEAYGSETENIFRMGIHYSNGVKYVHPTFLYESVWNLIGFIIINIFYKKKKEDGQIFLMYMTWYGLGRFFIEGLRTDSLYIGIFRVSQIVALATFIVGVILLVRIGMRQHRKKVEAGDYEELYSADKKSKLAHEPDEVALHEVRKENNDAEIDLNDKKEE